MEDFTVPEITADDHMLGPDDAPVTVLEYGDYECPHCGAAHPVVQEVRRIRGPNLRFVFRHFPLSESHPHAEHAADVGLNVSTVYHLLNTLVAAEHAVYTQSGWLDQERRIAQGMDGAA